jgi:hypothetical protein
VAGGLGIRTSACERRARWLGCSCSCKHQPSEPAKEVQGPDTFRLEPGPILKLASKAPTCLKGCHKRSHGGRSNFKVIGYTRCAGTFQPTPHLAKVRRSVAWACWPLFICLSLTSCSHAARADYSKLRAQSAISKTGYGRPGRLSGAFRHCRGQAETNEAQEEPHGELGAQSHVPLCPGSPATQEALSALLQGRLPSEITREELAQW